jgi:epoxyqueuosine reductase
VSTPVTRALPAPRGLPAEPHVPAEAQVPAEAEAPDHLAELTARLISRGTELGLDRVAVTSAAAFPEVTEVLRARLARGFSAEMAFTYRNPERSTTPALALPGAAALVVAARSYRRSATSAPETGPTGRIASYAWQDAYAPLRAALGELARELRTGGYRARVLVDDNSLVDRAAAVRAGIGAYGKNSLVLVPGIGSYVVLGSVVTDAPLRLTGPSRAPVAPGRREAPGPSVAPQCARCRSCLDACPTGALVAPGVLDARRCIAWLLEAPGSIPMELRAAVGDRIYGCDECQERCPINRVAVRRCPPPPADPGAEGAVELCSLLACSDDQLSTRFRRFYLAGRDPALLRRNCLIALGNTGERAGPARELEAVLAAALADDRPVVLAAAIWASARLDRVDLVLRAAGAPGSARRTWELPEIRAELAVALRGVAIAGARSS